MVTMIGTGIVTCCRADSPCGANQRGFFETTPIEEYRHDRPEHKSGLQGGFRDRRGPRRISDRGRLKLVPRQNTAASMCSNETSKATRAAT